MIQRAKLHLSHPFNFNTFKHWRAGRLPALLMKVLEHADLRADIQDSSTEELGWGLARVHLPVGSSDFILQQFLPKCRKRSHGPCGLLSKILKQVSDTWQGGTQYHGSHHVVVFNCFSWHNIKNPRQKTSNTGQLNTERTEQGQEIWEMQLRASKSWI